MRALRPRAQQPQGKILARCNGEGAGGVVARLATKKRRNPRPRSQHLSGTATGLQRQLGAMYRAANEQAAARCTPCMAAAPKIAVGGACVGAWGWAISCTCKINTRCLLIAFVLAAKW